MQRDNIIGTLHTDERVNGGLSPRERLTGYGSVGGGVSSYNELTDLPTMNGHTIEGDMTPADLDIWQPKDFSTSEENTGLKWIDGKDIYTKTIEGNNIGSTLYTLISNSDIDSLIFQMGYVYTNMNEKQTFPYSDNNDYCFIRLDGANLNIICTSYFVNRTNYFVGTIAYTKN